MRWWQGLWRGLGPKGVMLDAWADTKLKEVKWLAVDLELTSLDSKESAITSIGWVEGSHSQIHLGTAFYQVICTDASLQQSPVIHGLTAEQIARGTPLKPVLQALAQYAQSHIWIFHNSRLDMAVLNRTFVEHELNVPLVQSLDTLKLGRYLAAKSQLSVNDAGFTLSACRARYNLSPAPAHNALDDAMATMELAFAQLHQLDAKGETCLRDYGHLSGFEIWQ